VTTGFTPSAGQTFDVLTAAGVSGTFSSTSTPGYDVSYQQTLVRLTSNGTPTAFTVSRFGAVAGPHGNVLRWRTGSESGVLGFHLYRQRNGKLVRLTRVPVQAVGGLRGAAYTWRDPAGTARSRYRLQAVALDGSRSWLAAAAVRRS